MLCLCTLNFSMVFTKCFQNSTLLSGPDKSSERPSYSFSLEISFIIMVNIKKIEFFPQILSSFGGKLANYKGISNSCATYFITKQPHFGVFHAKGTVVVSTVLPTFPPSHTPSFSGLLTRYLKQE